MGLLGGRGGRAGGVGGSGGAARACGRLRFFHVFMLMMMAVWALLINQIGTIRVLDRVYVFGDVLSRRMAASGTQDFQVFTAVGYPGCKYFPVAMDVLTKMKASDPTTVYIYSWTAESHDEFLKWLDDRKAVQQVPLSHSTSPVIFSRVPDKRIFLGGVTELVEFARLNFPDVDLTEEVSRLNLLDARNSASAEASDGPAPPGAEQAELEEDRTLRGAEDAEDEDTPRNAHADQAGTDGLQPTEGAVGVLRPSNPGIPNRDDPVNALQPQVTLKNKMVTTYRIAEGKVVTNHKPILQSLREEGWSYMQSAPLLSGWILVQDQASAAKVLQRYHKAIANNIGYGGQSCFGGTKGTQIRCRSEFAQKHGCSFDTLNIQPPQYRLWILDECKRFFDEVCDREDRLWMEKPSGGQHGVGMKVRNGCAPIRANHGNCAAENGKRKYLIMPYLTPALLGGHKFDVRSFLLVASLDPQLAFYHDGFARKANSAYSHDVSDTNAHITNAVSQKSEDHFYSFKRLQATLHAESGFPPDYMERVFREHAFKVQNFVFQVSRAALSRRKGVYQVFALDWIIDDNGAIHMLEANSNPLVTVYKDLEAEYKETWASMTDLVLKVHTNPAALFTPQNPRMATTPQRFEHRGWHLIFNELEEQANGTPYRACDQPLKPFDLAKYKAGLGIGSGADGEEANAAAVRTPASGTNDGDSDLGGDDDGHDAGEEEVGAATFVHPKDREVDDDSDDRMPSFESEMAEPEPQEQALPAEHEPEAGTRRESKGGHGAKETPYAVSSKDIQAAVEKVGARPCVELDPFKVFSGCVAVDRGLGPADRTTRCEFTDGGFVYIIEPETEEGEERPAAPLNSAPGCHPVVMITAGVHGNEQAGIVAARHMRKTWTLRGARLVIVERLNPRGAEKRGRYIPRLRKDQHDLNRNFPVSGLVGDLAKDIWKMVAEVQPHFYVDMHEGWGFYNRLRANYQKGGPLVGNPNFSKGSSVIASPSALPLAQYMANRVNELTVTDHSKDFLTIVPPIETGLANMVMREFGALVIVIETTSGNQQLALRAQQQLLLVGTAVATMGLVPVGFDGRDGFDAPRSACVAGLQGCKLKHPDDQILIAQPAAQQVTAT